MTITKPFYKNPNEINDIQELRDYVKHLQDEIYKLINVYNDLETDKIDLEVRLNKCFVKSEEIKEIVNDFYT